MKLNEIDTESKINHKERTIDTRSFCMCSKYVQNNFEYMMVYDNNGIVFSLDSSKKKRNYYNFFFGLDKKTQKLSI